MIEIVEESRDVKARDLAWHHRLGKAISVRSKVIVCFTQLAVCNDGIVQAGCEVVLLQNRRKIARISLENASVPMRGIHDGSIFEDSLPIFRLVALHALYVSDEGKPGVA